MKLLNPFLGIDAVPETRHIRIDYRAREQRPKNGSCIFREVKISRMATEVRASSVEWLEHKQIERRERMRSNNEQPNPSKTLTCFHLHETLLI